MPPTRRKKGERVAEERPVRHHIATERARLAERATFISDPVALRATLAAIVDSSDDAIVSKDLEGTILTWNAAAERLFGYRAEEVIGRPITILMTPERVGEEPQILATLLRGERVDHFETERVRKDGSRISVSLSVSPIKDGTGRIVGAAKIARDITERNAVEREREEILRVTEQARGDAERANAAKDVFLAMLGHELRNPLAAINNAMAVLQAIGEEDQRAVRSRGVISRQLQHLTRMVDDLLDVARATSGKIDLDLEPVDVAESVQHCVQALTASQKAKHHTLQVEAESVWVEADPTRLEQIITNLLTNAVKYTPRGGTVHVSVRADQDDVVIRVEDTGIGIPPGLLPHIFEPFVQGEWSVDRAQGGLGIGLMHRLVELHKGRIAAASEGPGRGSVFTIRLPRIPPPLRDDMHRHALRTEGAHRRILVVEDSRDVRDSFRLLLEVAGHEVHEAEDGPSGVELARRLQPDIAFIDIGLPGFSGYEVAARLRSTPEGAAMIMVALTGYGQPEDRQRALTAGFDLHLLKPVRPEDLGRVLRAGSDRPRERGQNAAR